VNTGVTCDVPREEQSILYQGLMYLGRNKASCTRIQYYLKWRTSLANHPENKHKIKISQTSRPQSILPPPSCHCQPALQNKKTNVAPFPPLVVHGIVRPDVSVSIVGQNTDNDAFARIQELFTFSPFGLCCLQCGAKIQLEERSICNHLKKHHMDSKMSTVRSLLDGFTKQVLIAKESCTIEPYRSDQKTYMGYLCNCGPIFPRKDNALRHCQKKCCDVLKLQKIELIKLCCGQYVSQAQVCELFETRPARITEQFNYSEARATLLPFLPKMEIHDHTYTHMYTPLITQPMWWFCTICDKNPE
jgi:hypothetical protein